MDHSVTDQSSVLRFIEDNWLNGERIHGSFDAYAGPIDGMFNFREHPHAHPLILNPQTGLAVDEDED